jgi:MFS family permease
VAEATEPVERPKTGGAYAHYVLGTLVIVYVFNFVDRNILSILAEDIKADLGVTDAQMGFLYGTVFAVFYAVFGIPLARFADAWVRRSLIAGGLLFWSFMTAASGLARSFPALAALRVGVGIGEASASPAAFSMLSDYYPPHLRASVLAIYSSGVYIGGGVGLFLGGFILDYWNGTFPTDAPLGLKGWQVAFMAVGLPGILMAAWVRTLREPVRGSSEGLITERHPAPFKLLATELASVLPPLNLVGLVWLKASLRVNLGAAMGIAVVFGGLRIITGSIAQWIALGMGAYVAFSWAQSLKVRDPATFAMMFRSRAFIFTMLAFPTIAFVTYGTGFWTAPFLMRVHGASPTEVGLYVGVGSALGGLIGVTLGGFLADRLKLRTPNGRILVGFIAVFGTVPLVLWMVNTPSLTMAFILNFFYHIPSAIWPGIPPSTGNDLVMPRMRATASAYYIMVNTFIGLALGPYFMGQLSDVFHASGMSEADSLRTAISCGLLIFVLTIVFLVLAMRYLPADERSRLDRARALGEPVPT